MSLLSPIVTFLGTCFVSESRRVSHLHSLYVHKEDVAICAYTLKNVRALTNLADEAVSARNNVPKSDAE